MAWLYLFLAGLCEMAWPVGFKFTAGFTKNFWAILITMAVMLLSFWLMARAIREGIPLGTAYAVWTGIGATGTALLGIAMFQESRELSRLLCLGLIIAGVVGLKLLSPLQPAE